MYGNEIITIEKIKEKYVSNAGNPQGSGVSNVGNPQEDGVSNADNPQTKVK
jgi:hypothetical protein